MNEYHRFRARLTCAAHPDWWIRVLDSDWCTVCMSHTSVYWIRHKDDFVGFYCMQCFPGLNELKKRHECYKEKGSPFHG